MNLDNLYDLAEKENIKIYDYYMDATYNYANVDKVLMEKQEYRAKKWSYYVLIPFEKLKSAFLIRN